jgi:hypothetical protein
MEYSHDMAWYNRSLHRRLHVSELLAKQCHALQRIDWVQLGIDSEGNDMEHQFMVEETPTSGRMVKTIADWWMRPEYEYEFEGPLPDVVVEKDSYFESQLPSAWPRVRSAQWTVDI